MQCTRQHTISSSCLSHMFSHCDCKTGICQVNTCMNNLPSGFPDYQHIILISISFQFYYWRSSQQKILEKSKIFATYTHYIISTFQLSLFITAREMDFLIISSLFSLLYLSSSITREIANEKFWKTHSVLLHTPIISHTNFSSFHSQ